MAREVPSLSAYIPADRQRAIAAGISLPTRSHGAVLLADISGFTPLTEALTRALGQARGAEELVSTLDQVYDSLLREVHRFGGSVISFSGDGVICFFEGIEVHRAVAAAFAMQTAIQQFQHVIIPRGESISLTVKVAVAFGSIRRFQVGNPSIQFLDTLAGTAVDRLAEAAKLAGKGEVVCDEPTVLALANIAILHEWRLGNNTRYAVLSGITQPALPVPEAALDPQALSEEQVRPWLLAPVYDRLSSGQSDFLAELRYTVPVFVSFGGIDYEKDDVAGDQLDKFVRWVQQVVTRYEGALIDLTIGDKGSYLYVVFGAPIAHDDDAGRALATALHLLQLPDDLMMMGPIKIGISQGRMRAGAYGGVQRHTYGVLGDEVNVAARLMEQAAPNQILVTERIVNAVGERYRFTSVGTVPIKGKQDIVHVFKLVERDEHRPHKTASTTMVGRVAERATLSERLTALLRQKLRSVVIIEGDAGIGKTRLLEDLRQEAQNLSAVTLVGIGNAIEKSTPYYAWRSVFSQLFNTDISGSNQTAHSGDAISALERALPTDLIQLLPLLKAVLPIDIPDNELTLQMSGQVRADNTHLLLTGILQELALREPVVLEMEDAQWFDSASWSLISHVTAAGFPILLVIATRPLAEPIPTEYISLLNKAETTRLLLKPMPFAEVHTLIAQRLGVRRVPNAITELISKKAEGNPFFAEELAYALRDSELILIHDDECQLAPDVNLTTVTLPDAVQDLVTSRIDRLSPSQQLTIKVASVIGRIFIYRILYDSYPLTEERDSLTTHLATLGLLDLTTLEALEPELSYAFKHFITQEVSYSLMLFSQRRELHRKVADWYEKQQGDNLSAYYALLAHHWNNADQPLKAVDYLEKAGEQALRNFVNEEAVAFFEQALSLTSQKTLPIELSRQARWELQAGEAYVNLSDYRNGRRQIEAGLLHFGQAVPSKSSAQVTSVLKQLMEQIRHRKLPGKYRTHPKYNKQELLLLVRAYERLSEATYFLGETLIPVYSAFCALNLAEAEGPSPEAGRSAAAVGALLGFIPLHGLAQGYLDRASAIVNGLDHLESQEFVAMTSSYYYSGVGNWAKVRQNADQVLSLAEHLGDKRRWQDVTSHITAMHFLQGNFAASQELAEELYLTAHRRQDSRFMALAVQEKAHYALYTGMFDDAINHLMTLQTLIGDGDEITVIPLKMELLGITSLVHLRRGEDKEAEETARQSLDLAVKMIPSFYAAITGYAGPAEVYLTLWEANPNNTDFARGSKLAVQTLGKYERVFPIGKPRLLLNQGRYKWLTGKHSQAMKAWQSSLDHAKELRMLYDQAIAGYEIARHLPATDAMRQNHIASALNIFASLQARYDLERLQKL